MKFLEKVGRIAMLLLSLLTLALFPSAIHASELEVSVSPVAIEINKRDVGVDTIVDLFVKFKNQSEDIVLSDLNPGQPLSVILQKAQEGEKTTVIPRQEMLSVQSNGNPRDWSVRVSEGSGMIDLFPTPRRRSTLKFGEEVSVVIRELTVRNKGQCHDDARLLVKAFGHLQDKQQGKKIYRLRNTDHSIPINCQVAPEVSSATFRPTELRVGERTVLNFTAIGGQKVWITDGREDPVAAAQRPGRSLSCDKGLYRSCRYEGDTAEPSIRVTPSADFDLDENNDSNIETYFVYTGSDTLEGEQRSAAREAKVKVRMPTITSFEVVDEKGHFLKQPVWLTKAEGKSAELIDLYLKFTQRDAERVHAYCGVDPDPKVPLEALTGPDKRNLKDRSPFQVDLSKCYPEKSTGKALYFKVEAVSGKYKRPETAIISLRPMEVKRSGVSSPHSSPKDCSGNIFRLRCYNTVYFNVVGARRVEVALRSFATSQEEGVFGPSRYVETGVCSVTFYGPGDHAIKQDHAFRIRRGTNVQHYPCGNTKEKCCGINGTPQGIARYP